MRKLIGTSILILFLFTLPKFASAQETAGHSAVMSYNYDNDNSIIKRMAISRVLNKYNSPLVDQIDSFINSCTNYNLDCYLLPSITGLESYFGRYTYPGSHNPFGWGGGYIMFDTWDKAIDTVAKGLKENYVDKGAETIEEIAPIYAESPTWAVRVKFFKNQFEAEEKQLSLLLSGNEVKL